MALSSLLLSQLIPRESIELGRLVVDPEFPDQDFLQPPDATSPNCPSNATIQHIEDFQRVLGRAQSAQLHAKLLAFLSVGPFAASSSFSTTVSSPLCITRQLRNSGDYFRNACQNDVVRHWLEREFQQQPRVRPRRGWCGRSVYLVCGFKTLTDAHIKRSNEKDIELSVSAPIPIPIPIEVEAGAGLKRETTDSIEFKAPGEQVFAVQYRKLRFALFSRQEVDNAYLERGNRWRFYIEMRGEADETVKDGLAVEIDNTLGLTDMRGPCESCEIDSDEVFYWIEDDEGSLTE